VRDRTSSKRITWWCGAWEGEIVMMIRRMMIRRMMMVVSDVV
jgi:hypothetical protein